MKFFKNQSNHTLQKTLTRFSGEGVGAILARGASASLLIKIFSMPIAFGSQILLTRLMGVEHYGIYIYVSSLLSILLLLATMGWDILLIRNVSSYNEQSQWGALKGILRSSNYFVFINSLIVSALIALVTWIVKDKINSELTLTLWLSCAVLPVMALNSLRLSALQAFKKIVFAQTPELILRHVILAIFMVVTFSSLDRNVNAPLAMCLDLVARLICFFIGFYWLSKCIPPPVKKAHPIEQNREWLNTAIPLFLMSGMYIVLTFTDVIMIGAMQGTTEAGIYSVVTRIATLILFAISAVDAIAAPMISTLYSTGKHLELQQTLSLAAQGVFAISFPVYILLIFFGKQALRLFGAEFADGYDALVILSIGHLINALSGSVGIVMSMTGHQREACWVIGTSAIINICLNYLLIPIWGIQGAAIATTITTIGWNLVLTFFIWKRLKLRARAI